MKKTLFRKSFFTVYLRPFFFFSHFHFQQWLKALLLTLLILRHYYFL